jgi:hypothetical protein
MPAEIQFPHRRNHDGSWDSICTQCFLTIARSKMEGKLAEFEETHVCNSSFLADRGQFSDPNPSGHGP